ncbi:zinc finger protein on ecdysone puffs [Neodiprion pinetum]|uniref:Zinc finger protein on ecdysone puffs n=1 Tax=Neodiprion lecontei TaxID=441921 RepID=A0A6J0BZT0_NEOLC|nr:zinc finger protein on ecdysone puffs [Neodiprion lecontei]XP_046467490.1 zinc finger protein on ecdysone puffs [Neodiprion pinetum]
MSFNRGTKRDAFGNRGFNRNPGNAGGGVNPWEGGMMPGRGILPTPNNNLALASPQAQLAIASNLLSNLLRGQQDVQPQVPSLLSLGNNFGGPGPNFRGQQPFGPGRFNDRPMRRPMENRRSEPYKMGPRARDGPAGRRGQSAQQSRANQSGNQRINGNQNQHRNDKSSKPNPASKQNQTATVKKESQDVKTSDIEKADTSDLKSEETDDVDTKKRDWKDEKTKESTLSNKSETAEDLGQHEDTLSPEKTSATEPPKDGDTATASTDKEGKGSGKKCEIRHAESRYADVPMTRMFCHVCNKHMWDGYSFENHLRGRAHQLMMDKLDESYKLKVDLMRHDLRVAEEQRELSLTNSKRRGKKVSVDLSVREYCTMCDLNFYGTLSIHRKSEKHQQLKTFLHPRCLECAKEFPSRIEYDEHCLTPTHMKLIVPLENQRKSKKKEKLPKGESEVSTVEDEEKEVLKAEAKNDKEEELPESTPLIVDFADVTSDPQYKIPTFKQCRNKQITIGKSMVREVNGYYCEKCRRFMLTSDDMTAHLRGITHYRNFVQEVKSQISKSMTDAAAKTTEEPEADKDQDKIEKDSEEYEGNWKRRKTVHSEDEDDSDPKKPNVENDIEISTAVKPTDGDKKYDPLEADAESEDENHEGEGKKSSAEKMWADMDNDIDVEIGNLLEDDTGEEKVSILEPENTPQKLEKETTPIIKSTNQNLPRGRGGGYRSRGNRARRSRR